MLLATVGYNAGPARPPQWIARCGDPRGAQVDPVDFIECAPFTETRNYMMRVMENLTIYKARLGGGSAPLALSADLARGAGSGPVPYDDLAEDLGQHHIGQGLTRRGIGSHPAVMQDHDPVGSAHGQIEVVQTDQHRLSRPGPRPQPLHDQKLAIRIQSGRRLVGEDGPGRLGERAGD
eukprot:gene10537-14110_t